MKYKAVYDVLNERRQTTPGFCYHDRSGWRAYPQTYMTMIFKTSKLQPQATAEQAPLPSLKSSLLPSLPLPKPHETALWKPSISLRIWDRF